MGNCAASDLDNIEKQPIGISGSTGSMKPLHDSEEDFLMQAASNYQKRSLKNTPSLGYENIINDSAASNKSQHPAGHVGSAMSVRTSSFVTTANE